MTRSHPLADWCRGPLSSLLVEPEVGQVVVLHDVGLRLQPHFAGALGLRFAARRDEIRKADDFRADETLLDVRVNGATGLPDRRIAGRAWNGEFRRTTRFMRKPFTAFGFPGF